MPAKQESVFTPETLKFLKDLKKNNTREWFAANKKTYEAEIKSPAKMFCDLMTPELEKLTGHPHKSKVFRIHRDVRFSKDKTPYNSHLHISFLPLGLKGVTPGWMFGLSPDYLSIGVGAFEFQPANLLAFRAHVATPSGGKAFEKLLAGLEKKGARISEPALKRVPSGYDKDHPHGDLLRRKGLMAWFDLTSPKDAASPDLIKTCRTTYKTFLPLFKALGKLNA